MIERQHHIVEIPGRIRHRTLRWRIRLRQALQQPPEFIGKIADCAALKWRKPGLVIESAKVEIVRDCLERMPVNGGAIPARHPLFHDEFAEWISGNIGVASKAVVTHGTVEKAQSPERPQSLGGFDRFQPWNLTNVQTTPPQLPRPRIYQCTPSSYGWTEEYLSPSR